MKDSFELWIEKNIEPRIEKLSQSVGSWLYYIIMYTLFFGVIIAMFSFFYPIVVVLLVAYMFVTILLSPIIIYSIWSVKRK